MHILWIKINIDKSILIGIESLHYIVQGEKRQAKKKVCIVKFILL